MLTQSGDRVATFMIYVREFIVSEIFSIKVADKQTDRHTDTHPHINTSTDNKGRLKLAARESIVISIAVLSVCSVGHFNDLR